MKVAANAHVRYVFGSMKIGVRAALQTLRRSLAAYVFILFAMVVIPTFATRAQGAQSTASSSAPLQSYFDAAQSFQQSGDYAQAALQFQLFIVNALDRLAITRSSIGDYTRASALFNEALAIAPNNRNLQLDDAEAALAAKDLPRARSLAQGVVSADPANAAAHQTLGRILLQAGENDAAQVELEKAVAIDPDFTNGYALAAAYLKLRQKEKAATIFDEMEQSLGDKAALHMEFGLAYGNAGFPEDAIQEFQRTIAEDAKFPGAHYSLGASYLLSIGEIDYPQAITEFQKELEISPNDFLSHAQLGYIALSQHRVRDAENELARAAQLNPTDPDVFMSLGQLYVETMRGADAETALRKSISLTSDVAHHHYQVQRAHYLLARVLLQTNRVDEGKSEMQISQQLLSLSAPQTQGRAHSMSGNDLGENVQLSNGKGTAQIDPGALSAAEAQEKQLGAAIADSYNNIGVTAARNSDYASACDSFEKAAAWNPSLEGLDFNWGRAAYAGHLYARAIAPLSRYLQTHLNDMSMRSALGLSLFLVQNYGAAVKVLESLATSGDANPTLAFAYAESLVEAGQVDSGIARLKLLEASDPQDASYHRAVGEAQVRRRDFTAAAGELQAALKIDEKDTEAKYYLATTFIQLRQTKDAQDLLQELAQARSKNPDVYYRLGKLQLENADAKSAIASLQQAVALSPGSELIHLALAAAYRQDARPEDADREMKQAEGIRNSHGSAMESPHKD
jgi:tetratricopeptide (TPR) repeat protein